MYIGQSSDIENRWVKHINFLKNGKHHNKHLQAAWKFYGEENFEFSVIEECTEKELNQKEQYYMWNFEPNQNMNASQFMQKLVWSLIYKNECLVIQTAKGNFLIADSYEHDQ